MAEHRSAAGSTFPLGRRSVRRPGYGAMQLGGPFTAGPPADPATAAEVLRAAVAAGVDHIDTAQYYGAANDLIREADLHFAFGDPASGPGGFCLTYLQAMAAETVALAAGSPAPRLVTFAQVAPVAMMLGSADLLRGWVRSTLAGLAADDEHHARLRATLLVFLQSGGSYKTTAERLMLHKNSVQYRIRKAEESLGRPLAENRPDIELALQVSHWLGAAVLRRPGTPGRAAGDREHRS